MGAPARGRELPACILDELPGQGLGVRGHKLTKLGAQYHHSGGCQHEKDHTQNDGHPEECLFDAPSGCKDTTGITTRQTTETGAFTLQYNASDQSNRRYNQSDI
jgi:hypothetical protein